MGLKFCSKAMMYQITGFDISQQHSSNDFINYFTSKMNTIRDQTVTMQLPAAVSHQIVHCSSLEEQSHSLSTIGEEALYKLVKSAKPTTCMLDPIPSKLLGASRSHRYSFGYY